MSGTETNAFTPLDGVLGDVSGAAEICENEMWKTVVLCQGGGEMQWTTENTVVACRELGHPAAGIYVPTLTCRTVLYVSRCSRVWNIL